MSHARSAGEVGPAAAGRQADREDGRSAALAFIQKLAALEEGPIRARAAGRILATLGIERTLDLMVALFRRGDAQARLALAAVGQALLDPVGRMGYPVLADLYTAAKERELTEVTSLLLAPPPRCAWREPYDKANPRSAGMSLGHKKSLARLGRDPDLLARLAAEGDPTVVRELLRNPQLTESFAVRIAARRPCRPETLRCIFEARRWRTRTDVMLALARNPYAEPEIVLKLLPSLPSAELEEMARDGAIHPLVRSLAARLSRQRAAERAGHGSGRTPR